MNTEKYYKNILDQEQFTSPVIAGPIITANNSQIPVPDQ